jgi:hypothetical protein
MIMPIAVGVKEPPGLAMPQRLGRLVLVIDG